MNEKYFEQLKTLMSDYHEIEGQVRNCTCILSTCANDYPKPLAPHSMSDIRLRFGKMNWLAIRKDLAVLMQKRLKVLDIKMDIVRKAILDLKP